MDTDSFFLFSFCEWTTIIYTNIMNGLQYRSRDPSYRVYLSIMWRLGTNLGRIVLTRTWNGDGFGYGWDALSCFIPCSRELTNNKVYKGANLFLAVQIRLSTLVGIKRIWFCHSIECLSGMDPRGHMEAIALPKIKKK